MPSLAILYEMRHLGCLIMVRIDCSTRTASHVTRNSERISHLEHSAAGILWLPIHWLPCRSSCFALCLHLEPARAQHDINIFRRSTFLLLPYTILFFPLQHLRIHTITLLTPIPQPTNFHLHNASQEGRHCWCRRGNSRFHGQGDQDSCCCFRRSHRS